QNRNRNPKPLHKRQLRKPIIVYRAQSHLWLRSTPSSFRFTAQKKQRNAPEPNSAVRITGAPIFRSRRDRIRSIRSISVLMSHATKRRRLAANFQRKATKG